MQKCPYCNRKYKTQSKYDSHVKQHSEDERAPRVVQEKKPNDHNAITTFYKCPVIKCNRKYKSKDRRDKHVKTDHYYDTQYANCFQFNHSIKAKIYGLASSYLELLHRVNQKQIEVLHMSMICKRRDVPKDIVKIIVKLVKAQYVSEIRKAAINLLPQNGGKHKKSGIERLVRAQRIFSEKFLTRFPNETKVDWQLAMKDLEGFFQLGLPYQDTNFCPSLMIDFMWHSLMQTPELYEQICSKSTGHLVPHCVSARSDEEDEERYQYFLDVFKHRHGRDVVQTSTLHVGDALKSLQQKEQNIIDQEKQQRIELELKEAETRRRREEEFKKKREMQHKEMKEFSEKMCVSVSNWFQYQSYYIPAANQGLRGQQLENCVRNTMAIASRSFGGGSC